jgi:hypothetical protein
MFMRRSHNPQLLTLLAAAEAHKRFRLRESRLYSSGDGGGGRERGCLGVHGRYPLSCEHITTLENANLNKSSVYLLLVPFCLLTSIENVAPMTGLATKSMPG